MDPSIWTGLFIFLAVSVTLGLIIYASKAKKTQREFNSLVSQKNMVVSTKEFWGNSAIAIDEGNKQLIFIRDENKNLQTSHILLKDMAECQITKENGKDDSELIMIKITYANSDSTPTLLCFFDSMYDNVFEKASFAERATKWKKIIDKNSK